MNLQDVTDFWRTASNEKWHALGHSRVDKLRPTYRGLLDKCIAVLGRKPETAVDWGVGGGLAAGMLQDDGCAVYGVDIVERGGPFIPVTIDIEQPEDALTMIGCRVDLFVCLTVVQHLPSLAYTERIVRLSRELLVPGGVALFQIRSGKLGAPKMDEDGPYKVGWTRRIVVSVEEFQGIMEGVGYAVSEEKPDAEGWATDYHYLIGKL